MLGMVLCAIVIAFAVLPPSLLIFGVHRVVRFDMHFSTVVGFALLVGLSYVIFCLSILAVAVLAKKIFRLRCREGQFGPTSPELIRFALHHGLLNLAQIFSLRLVRGTSIANAFYRGMGVEIGDRTFISTGLISDCDLIRIGNDCVIGGDATINGHTTEFGLLVRKRVSIGNRITIGQGATILPGTTIEDDVVLGAHSVVPKSRVLSAGHIYAGVPARQIGTTAARTADTTSQCDFPPIEGFILDPSQLNIQQILLEAYKLKHAEMLDLVRFMSQVTVAALGLLTTILVYGFL